MTQSCQNSFQRCLNGILLAVLFLFTSTRIFSQTYNWKSVQIQGGGFVSGFIYSKADPSLLFMRTDVGGAYRWNQSSKTWTPLTDALLNASDWGVWSMAADPTDANKVYMATGLYSASWGKNGSIYRSNDKGVTWTNISNLPIKLGGNDPARGNGERLVVDPNKPTVLFLGSKKDGLYKSTDSGVNWSKVTSLSASYITFVEFDKATGTTGNSTQNIYVGVADNIYNGRNVGIYRSTDGGSSWNKLTNHPTQLTPKSFAPGNAALTPVPSDMYITTGNTIYFTFCNTVTPDGDHTLSDPHKVISNGAVYKFNKSTNAWTDITPSGSSGMQGGFSSVSASATNSNKIAIATIGRWWPHDEVYFSSDAGANWTSTFNSYNYSSTWGNSLNKATISTTKAPYAAQSTIGWPSSIEISPTNDNQVMISSGGGVFACYDVSTLFTNATSGNTASTTWVYENDGVEETVPLELVSPPSGAPLVSAIGDIDGFVHSNLDVSPAQGKHGIEGTHTGTTRSIAFAENLPSKMVRAFDNNTFNKGAYSVDGGLTWTRFANKPAGVNANDQSGKIAISADGNRILWASVNAAPAYSSDNGSTWTASTGGVPNGLKPVADRVNKDKFYVFDASNQKLYYSTNGAASFSNTTLSGTTGVPNYEEYQPELCAALANEGHLWLANQNNGLFRSVNGGQAWTKITTVTSAIKVTTGKSATTNGYPTVFIWGVVNGVNGVFRSDDQGSTWEQLNDASTAWANNPTTMSGDPRIYGRLYLGIGGRGIMYGDKSTATCSATITSPSTNICPTGSVLLTASTGASYKWFNGTTQVGTAATYRATAAGSYTVEVTNASGCKATSAATTITGSTQATPTISSPSTNICPTGSVLLTASTGASYKWFNGTTQVGTAATYSATAAGSYTVEVTNASGCKATSAATTITGSTQTTPTISSPSTNICPTGSVLLTASTGASYKWFNGTTQVGTAATYSATAAGSYTVEVTNASGCKATSAATTITGSTQTTPTISAPSTNICPAGSVLLTASTGASYKWFNGTTQVGTAATYRATAAGSYTVEVTNASGCKATSAATTITGSTQATPTISSPSTNICPTGSVLLTASTGASYKWFNGTTQVGTAATYSATAAGSYTVEVTNASGCKATSAATTITGSTQATPTISSPSTNICPTGSVLLTASTGASYKWFNGTTQVGTAATYRATAAGSYTVEVTNASGCKATSAATTITGSTQATPTISSSSTAFCSGGSVLLTSSTGASYKWFNGTTQVGTAATYRATAAGSYTVEVTNASGCKATSAATAITETASITWYQDTDGDGEGDPAVTISACTQPTGYVATAGDACPNDPDKTLAGNCGCGNTETSCLDCAGIPNGTAFLDNCTICVGGTTGKTACVTTATINGSSAHISVTPQPFQTTTTIKLDNIGTIQSLVIINSSGSIADSRRQLNTTEITVGESLVAGMYSVIITTEKGIYTTKIVKY